ncbi:hypothetical protein [Streptomyces sp. NRRL B-1347]|uniref:hypothetical protein n=1 Tax=Streptomyces sp. NRRL B-1347 TaxID=1476877 RepID=UPI00131C4106|nr:hypothetical protein [Streptomyces sp. NRRL B-1347]
MASLRCIHDLGRSTAVLLEQGYDPAATKRLLGHARIGAIAAVHAPACDPASNAKSTA